MEGEGTQGAGETHGTRSLVLLLSGPRGGSHSMPRNSRGCSLVLLIISLSLNQNPRPLHSFQIINLDRFFPWQPERCKEDNCNGAFKMLPNKVLQKMSS